MSPCIPPQDHAETDDRAIAVGRYKVFAREKVSLVAGPRHPRARRVALPAVE